MSVERAIPHRIFDARERTVWEPSPELKTALRVRGKELWGLLLSNPDFQKLYYDRVIHGVRRRRHSTHAWVHREAGSIVVFDLYRAFESTTKEKVLTALERLEANQGMIEFLEENAFIDNFLPPGFPTSPNLFNAALIPLDLELVEFSRNEGFKYSRYADDFAFSTPKEVRFIEQPTIDAIREIIGSHGYDCHHIRLGHPWSQPFEICGVTLHQGKITISKERMRRLRGQIHRCLILEKEPNPAKALSYIGYIETVRGRIPPSLWRYKILAKRLLKEKARK